MYLSICIPKYFLEHPCPALDTGQYTAVSVLCLSPLNKSNCVVRLINAMVLECMFNSQIVRLSLGVISCTK